MSNHDNSMRSSMKQVRGLGAAHEGVGHFLKLRITSLILIPTCVWFVVAFINQLMNADRAFAANWFQNPFHSIIMAVFIVALALHARLGMQEIIIDYVHCQAKKFALLLLNDGSLLAFTLASLCAIVRLHFIGI